MKKGLSASVFNSPYFNVSRANESSLEEILFVSFQPVKWCGRSQLPPVAKN